MKIITQPKPEIEFVLISCCTCKRPHMLEDALQSVDNLNICRDIKIALLVVDNDKEETAREVVEKFKQTSRIPIFYAVEEQRGIAYARNRVLKEAIDMNASHIAFFDDDEILEKNWLCNHINFYRNNSNVIISSGPTYTKFNEDYPSYIRNNKIFKTSTTKKTGTIRNICASGNVFFPVAVTKNSDLWFDNRFVFMGGEDGDFFSRAARAGYTIVWNNDAVNYELAGPQRANLRWILNRYYYNGYSGAMLKFLENKNMFSKFFYLIKSSVSLIFCALLLIPSLLCGLTVFFNVLGLVLKNKGKIDLILINKPLDYYKNVNGN